MLQHAQLPKKRICLKDAYREGVDKCGNVRAPLCLFSYVCLTAILNQ